MPIHFLIIPMINDHEMLFYSISIELEETIDFPNLMNIINV